MALLPGTCRGEANFGLTGLAEGEGGSARGLG